MITYGPYGRPWPVEDLKKCVGPGWGGIVEHLVSDLFAEGWNGSVHQVKEKFGGLRFYTGETSVRMDELIREAEMESFATCEQCGVKEGVTSDPIHGWILTLCGTCREGKR